MARVFRFDLDGGMHAMLRPPRGLWAKLWQKRLGDWKGVSGAMNGVQALSTILLAWVWGKPKHDLLKVEICFFIQMEEAIFFVFSSGNLVWGDRWDLRSSWQRNCTHGQLNNFVIFNWWQDSTGMCGFFLELAEMCIQWNVHALYMGKTSGFLWSSHGNLVLFWKMMSLGLLRVLSIVVAKRFADELFQIISIRVAF